MHALPCMRSWLVVLCLAPTMAKAAQFLEGRVTDELGRPIEGASVTILDCIGTCWGGKTVLTDADGHYVFEKKAFRNWPALQVELPGRYEVSRKETGPKLHDEATNTPRRVDFVLGTPAAALVYLEGEAPQGWTQSFVFRSGPDAKIQRNEFDVTAGSDPEYGYFALLPRNESLHLVVVREPIVEASDDPAETEERRRDNWRNRVEIVSPPIKFVDTQQYNVRAKLVPGGGSGASESRIEFESVTDSVGNDRTKELAGSDPRFGAPVDAEAREKALALLERVKDSAIPWNASPLTQVDAYEYDFVDHDGTKTHVKLEQDSPTGPAWSDISRLRGFAYMPPLRWLFSQPENVMFLGVEIDDNRAVLHYRLKERRGFGAGLGIGPSWNGFFTSNFSRGTMVIDVKTATVLEHRLSRGPLDKESVETFSDYVAVGSGYAPRSLRIQSGDFDLRLKCAIHNDRLWLLERAFHGEENEPTARIENVAVSGGD